MKTRANRFSIRIHTIFLAIASITCATAQSGDPLWTIGTHTYAFPQSGGGGVAFGSLPQSFDPLIPNSYEYQGTLPVYSQNVQYDGDGNVLFFIVDGRVYNSEGLLLADNVDDPSCQVCMWKGTSRIGIIPVPGSCTLYFIVAGEDRTDRDNDVAYLRLGVLDLSLLNDLPLYSPAQLPMGRFIKDGDVSWDDLILPDLVPPFDLIPVPGASGDEYVFDYELPDTYTTSHDAVRFDIVETGPDGRRLLIVESALSVNFILFPEVGYSSTQAPILLTSVDKDPYDVEDGYRSIRGEVEAKIVGSTLKVACSRYAGYEDVADPFHDLKVVLFEFDMTGYPGALTLISPPNEYDLDQYFQSANQPEDGFGNVIVHPRVAGLEFSPNGQYLYFAKSCYSPAYDYNMGYIDTDVPPGSPGDVNELDLGTHDDSRWYADTELEINIGPTGSGEAIYAVRGAPSGHYLDALTDPDAPAPSNMGTVLMLPDYSNRTGLGPVQYRLLDSRVDDCSHLQFLHDAIEDPEGECCMQLAMTGIVSTGLTVSTSNLLGTAWAPGSSSNPFPSAPVEVVFTGNVIVPNGVSLYVNGMIWRFTNTARLIVQEGGMARFDGCLLTSIDCPGQRWPGVLVNGTTSWTSQSNAHQGRIYLNGSEVSNARYGVWCATLNALGTGVDPAGFGGRVNAVNSVFRNNIRGVVITQFHRLSSGTVMPNFSTFTNCAFITDEAWPDPGVNVPLYHAWLKKVDFIRFTNCSFENTNHLTWDPGDWGWGIYTQEASVNCTGGTAYTSNRFSHLKIGAMLEGPTPNYVNKFDGMGFFENVRGIHDQANWHTEVTNNRFDMVASVQLPPGEASVGLFEYQGELYLVERNLFTCDEDPYSPSVGIWFRGPAYQENRIYDNTFEHLTDGCVVQGDHETIGVNGQHIGLQLLCGDHEGNTRDQALLLGFPPANYTHIRLEQGVFGDVNALANNRFIGTPTCTTTTDIVADGGLPTGLPDPTYVKYNYFDYSGNPELRPECVLGTIPTDNYYDLVPTLSPVPFDKEDNCPNGILDLAGGSLETIRQSYETKLAELASAVANYEGTVDQNKTEDIIADLKKDDPPYPSYYLRDLLLGMYPLSDEVMIAAIERDPPLDPWHLTQALIQNMKLSDKVWSQVKKSEYLPPYFLDMIAQYDDQVSLKSLLEQEVNVRQVEKASLQQLLIHAWMADSVSAGRVDSIDAVLAADTAYLTRMQRYSWAIAHGNYTLAGDLSDPLAGTDDAQTIVELGKMHEEVNGDWDLVDNDARQRLLELAFDDQIYGSAQAWGIALGLELTDSIPDSYLPPMYRGSLRPTGTSTTAATMPALAAYPNPATERVMLAFPEWAGEGSIQVFDAQGRLQVMHALAGQPAFVEVSLRDWSEGIYLARLVMDGLALGECKFTVMK